MTTTFIILLGLGIFAGILAGLLGIGGGILFTPILFVVFSDAGIDEPVVLTIGTSLFCTFIAAAASSARQYRQDNFYGGEGLRVGLLGAAGVSLGKLVITSAYYSAQVFVIVFSMLLLYVAFMFIRRGRSAAGAGREAARIGWRRAMVSGGAGGFVAALAGIGGGGVMVPVMNLYYRQPFRKAVSVSSLAIVLISLAGWLQLGWDGSGARSLTAWAWGYVDFGAALPLAAGAMIGGFVGALMNVRINQRYLQYLFAVLVLGMAVKLLTEAF